MIRIDEIYYNVFVKALQHRNRVGLHWFDPFGSTDFADICNQPPVDGVADLRIIFWDQEPLYRDRSKIFFDQFCGIYRGPKIIVTSEINSNDVTWVCDTYELEHAYYFFHGWAALDWYRGYDHSFLSVPWMQRSFSSRLLCANNIIGSGRSHRVRFLNALYQRSCLENNQISFPERCPYSDQSTREIFSELGMEYPRDLTLPLMIDREKNHANDSHRIGFWSQAMTSFAHVVTETVYDDHRIHLTEKIFKPIVLQQPFLLVGSKGGLKYLKEYGFRTFDKIWDESYDDLPELQRLLAVADICEKINSWNQDELMEAQYAVKDIVEHNHAWFYGDFQSVLWKELTSMVKNWQ
jgi:hypothetical protein